MGLEHLRFHIPPVLRGQAEKQSLGPGLAGLRGGLVKLPQGFCVSSGHPKHPVQRTVSGFVPGAPVAFDPGQAGLPGRCQNGSLFPGLLRGQGAAGFLSCRRGDEVPGPGFLFRLLFLRDQTAGSVPGDFQGAPGKFAIQLRLHQEATQAGFQGHGAVRPGLQGCNPSKTGHIQHVEPDPGAGLWRALGVLHGYGETGGFCVPAGFVVHEAHALTLNQGFFLQALPDEVKEGPAAHHHGPAGGAVEPTPVQDGLRLAGA